MHPVQKQVTSSTYFLNLEGKQLFCEKNFDILSKIQQIIQNIEKFRRIFL